MHFLPTPSKRWFSTATSAVKHNVFIRNSETAAKVAEAFVPAGTKDKVVIEAFPGTMDFPDPPVRRTDNNSCRTRNIDACLAAAAEGADSEDYCARER